MRGAKSLLSIGTSVLEAPHGRNFGFPPAARMGAVKPQLAHTNCPPLAKLKAYPSLFLVCRFGGLSQRTPAFNVSRSVACQSSSKNRFQLLPHWTKSSLAIGGGPPALLVSPRRKSARAFPW